MALIFDKIYSQYIYLNYELADPRVKDYPLLNAPLTIITIMICYLYFVLKLGPKLMEKRRPFKLKQILIVFNAVQIILCSVIVVKFVQHVFFNCNWRCEPIDYSDKPVTRILLNYTWLYFLLKFLDLLDTIFFVLRKKFSQITFLHVYHHAGMFLMSWVGLKYVAGGTGLFLGFANCVVHVFMYTYYLISAWDEKYKKSVWWKKYITQLQMGQFLFLTIMFGQVLFQPDCTYPRWIVMAFLPQNFFMLILFGDFYRKTYLQQKPQRVHLNGETTSTDKTVINKHE